MITTVACNKLPGAYVATVEENDLDSAGILLEEEKSAKDNNADSEPILGFYSQRFILVFFFYFST